MTQEVNSLKALRYLIDFLEEQCAYADDDSGGFLPTSFIRKLIKDILEDIPVNFNENIYN